MRLLPFSHSPDGTLLRSDHFEAVARLAVPVRRGHPADQEQFVAAHPLLLGVEQFVAQVDTFDPKPALAKWADKNIPTGNLTTERPTGAALPVSLELLGIGLLAAGTSIAPAR